jgi:hypothetical protein
MKISISGKATLVSVVAGTEIQCIFIKIQYKDLQICKHLQVGWTLQFVVMHIKVYFKA